VVEFLAENGILVHPPQPYVIRSSLWDDIPMQR
jgi:hypothetical protein